MEEENSTDFEDLIKVLAHLVPLEVAQHKTMGVGGGVLEQLDKLVGTQMRAVLLREFLQEFLVLGLK